MQSEEVISRQRAGSLATAGATTATASKLDIASMPDGDPGAAERWRIWSARGLKHDRERARTIKRGFIALVAALSAWLVFQLLS
jgi:hypothetical protein